MNSDCQNNKENYLVTVTDYYNEVFVLPFSKYQYPNLRVLIAENYPEEFGECKGRGLCGTCHVKSTTRDLKEKLSNQEIETLRITNNSDNTSRLACQILLNEEINNRTFKIITEQ